MFRERPSQDRLAGGGTFPRGRLAAALTVIIALVFASLPHGAFARDLSSPGENEARGAAAACRPYLSKLRRRENRYWVWYAPRGWSASWGRNGIDITPRTGPSMVVSQGFAGGSPFSITHKWVFNNLVRKTVPGRVRVLSRSRITSQGGVSRRVWQWRTKRIRGKSTTFVFDVGGAYGFQANTNAARIRLWSGNKRLLDCIQSKIFYQPS